MNARAFIGIGSNVGDRMENLVRAVEAMGAQGLKVARVSSVYDTDPVGPAQENFLNAALQIDTDLDPSGLVAVLKSIEQQMGRVETGHWGPRLVDLDLLLFGGDTVNEPGLTVPHAELTNRAFALVPVLEIDPDVELPSGEPLGAFCEKDPPGVRLFSSGASLLGGAAGPTDAGN